MTDKTVSRRPGRPRGFDEATVIEQAQKQFLKDGFEATSYEQIALATGLAKPSLYNAFGDKKALFERALDDYARRAVDEMLTVFSSAGTLAAATRKLLLAAADTYSREEGPSVGCLLIGTSLPACAQHEGVAGTLATFTGSLDASLERIVSERYASDASRMGRSPRQLALLVGSLVFSLAIRARGGVSRKELRSMAAELAKLCGPLTEG